MKIMNEIVWLESFEFDFLFSFSIFRKIISIVEDKLKNLKPQRSHVLINAFILFWKRRLWMTAYNVVIMDSSFAADIWDSVVIQKISQPNAGL